VPPEQFRQNLLKILTHPLIQAHAPRILLITTPAVDEYQLADEDRPDGSRGKDRSAQNAQLYASVGRDVATQLRARGHDIAVCDLWTAMMEEAGWAGADAPLPGSQALPQNPVLKEMLYDGSLFSPSSHFIP
jgi:hypothetical protein